VLLSPSAVSVEVAPREGVITALTLEHYPGMADAEIRRHVDQAIRAMGPLTGVTIIHRYGT